jgi:hypothetical protein
MAPTFVNLHDLCKFYGSVTSVSPIRVNLHGLVTSMGPALINLYDLVTTMDLNV